MHCVSSYPCNLENINFPRLEKLKTLTNQTGYSGHFSGVDDAIAAITLGASYIEKHFTIDKDLPGRDNKFAILPHQLRDLTNFIKNRELMLKNLGSGYNEKENDSRLNYTGRFNG